MMANRLGDLALGVPIKDWLVLGPFVVRTGGDFEREYMYEREHIIDIDYLKAEGGEARVRPALNQSHANPGLGPKRLVWQAYPESDLDGVRLAGDIIYETVQRNCVIYAAAYIASESDGLALLDSSHSGMKAWMNGELIGNAAYGRAKGVRVRQPSLSIRLRRGENLLLVKFRPGYICDGIDFNVRQVMISPLISAADCPIAMGRVRALPNFAGTLKAPRQVIEAALLSTVPETLIVRVSAVSPTLSAEDSIEVQCSPCSVTPVRLALNTPRTAGGRTVTAVLRVMVAERVLEVPFEYIAAVPPKHDGTLMVLSSFHFDTTYHEEQRVYAMGAFDIMRQYCALHRADPLFKSTISEIDYLKPYFDVYPEDRGTLLAAFREGRAEPDVMYNQPNEQNCGGEALVRNFLYGQLFHGRVLGRICHVYGPGDVFGHPNQLSQIARKSGCIGVTWDKHIYNFPPFFEHLALDGSSLPHKRGGASWAEAREMGLSVITGEIDQTPPTDWHQTLLPKVQQATYHDLMSEIRRECAETGAHLPVTSRDMSLYHAATAMSRVELKLANRRGENLLISAEKFATLAALLGAHYPEKALDKAWRQILCGQHHDSITGTHNEISYVDLMNAYRETLELTTDVLHRSLDYLGRAIDTAGAEFPLVVFNPLAWERTDTVRATVVPGGMESFTLRDHRGRNVPFEVSSIQRNRNGGIIFAELLFVGERIPSLGYRSYRLTPGKKPLPVRQMTTATVIENEFYRIEVDPARGGGMISLYDKQAKREVLDTTAGHVGNELVALAEAPDREETQHEFYTTGLKLLSGERPASVEVEQGPVSAMLRTRYAMGEICDVVQEITLVKGVPRIEFRTMLLDWQGEDQLFAVTFPTRLRGAVPIFDERFGVVTRNDSKHYLDFRTHRMCMFSDCAVYAANKWMEYGVSALVTAGRNRYALGMVGLITPKHRGDVRVAEDIQRVLVKKGVTCTPWYDKKGPFWGSYLPHRDEDLLYTRFRISLGSGGRNVYSAKLLKKQPPVVRRAFEKRLKRDGHACLLVKDGDLLDTSWPALPVLIVEAKNSAELGAAFDVLLANYPKTATITLPAEANVTGERHRVDDYGVAVLNEGTYANSVEKGGVICMMLAHTCRWYGGTKNFPEGYLVPENKNHVFRYALYPHAGDWRAAKTQQAGHAFNHPLIARQTKPAAKPCLPPELAFLEVAPNNIILAAMKPSGNPVAALEKNAVCNPARGVILRLYDTEGVDAQARLRFAGGVRQAWTANLLEERKGDLAVEKGEILLCIPPFSIETIGFVPGKIGRRMGARGLGVEAEPVQPVWVRSWEHDAESMPMGYAPVVCSLSRRVVEEDGGASLRIKVQAVNDYIDARAQVFAEVLAPKGWQIEPAAALFSLPPLGHQTGEVVVHRPDIAAAGQIKLRYAWDGQVFQDVLEIGGVFDMTMMAENRGNMIIVTVGNPTFETIEGEVSLVSPLETWPSDVAGAYSLIEITPRTQGVALAAGESVELTFMVRSNADASPRGADSYWAVAKLMSNGRIQLKRCDCYPGRRVLSDRIWHRRLAERTGQRGIERNRWWNTGYNI